MAFKSFLKKGAEGTQMAQQHAINKAKEMEERGKLWRFYILLAPPGQKPNDARITFCDGDLSAEGILEPPRYYEHNMYINGNWNNYFVCPEKTSPENHDKCPLCESGDRAYLVALFTIIDHRQFTTKQNVVVEFTKKLLAAKPQTLEMLNQIAVKRGGLTNGTFDVSRIGDKAAAVGSMFDFVEKLPLEVLKKKYVRKWKDPKTNEEKVDLDYFSPADYDKEIIYRTGEELCKLGLGKPMAGAGMMAPGGSAPTGEVTDYTSQL